jgi:NAD-dependent deacetylase
VNITNIALRAAIMTGAEIDVVDPSPIDLKIDRVTYHAMNAADFIAKA